jgi:hypothetical protein
MEFQGIPVEVTHEPGAFKLGKGTDGKGWMTRMKASRGVIKGLDGQGRREVKTWIGPNEKSETAFVIHQKTAAGDHDEQKLVLGFDDPVHAVETLMKHYPASKHPIASIHQIPTGGLEDWIADGEAWAESAHQHHSRPHEHGGILAFFEGKRIKAEKVNLELPDEVAKAEPMQDGDRWITVHPNGPGSKGNAVLLRPVKGEPGVHRVVGGAGGSLNFMRIHLTKNPEDYKKESLERRTKTRAEEKAKLAAMTPEQREAHTQALTATKENKKVAEREFIRKVLGDDTQEGEAPDLFQDGPEADPKQKTAYHRERLRQAFAACKEAERKITLDAEARIGAGLAQVGGGITPGLAIDSIITTPDAKGIGYDRAIKARATANGMSADKLIAATAQWKEAQGFAQVNPTDPAAPKNEQKEGAAIQAHVATKELQAAKAAAMKEAVDQALQSSANLSTMLKARAELRGAYEEAMAAKTGRIFAPGFLATASEPTPEDREAIIQDLTEKVLRGHVAAFLDEVEKDNPDSPILEGAWSAKEAEGMMASRGAAAWDALHEAGLAVFGEGLLDRDTVETLGAEASAQVLGRAIRKRFNPADQKEILTALEQHHILEQQEELSKATEEAERLRSEAMTMKDQLLSTPKDFAAAAEINRTRVEALKQARSVLGAALGRFEARAALIGALRSTPAKDLQVPLGRTTPEKAIQAAAAIGLMPDHYTLDHTAGESVLTIPEAGQDAIIKPIDHAAVAERELAMSIKRGDLDKDGYIPTGFANRPKDRHENPLMEPPVFQRKIELPEGANENHLEDSLKRYIGQRWADGERATSISADLRGMGARDQVPEHLHATLDKLVNKLVPTHEIVRGEDGELVPEMHEGQPLKDTAGNVIYKVRMREPKQIAESVAAHGKGYLTSEGEANLTLQGQEVDSDHPDFREAVHRTLADDPRLQAAHAPVAELTDIQRAAVRDWFYKEHHKGQVAQSVESLGPEPPKFDETTGGMGLFEDMGQMENPAWTEYQEKKTAITKGGSPWGNYIRVMGGLKAAQEAIQSEMKGKFADAFHAHYGKVTGKALQLGTMDIDHYSTHIKATAGADKAEEIEAERKSKQAVAQKQGGGKFKSVKTKEKMEQAGEASLFGQGGGLFSDDELEGGAEESPKWEKPEAAPGERLTLGGRLEDQIRAVMPSASEPFQSKRFNPTKVAEGLSMSGRFAAQQRGIKGGVLLKRMGLFYGAGSGKTAIMMGTASELVHSGKAKKIIMAVPSIVQGQFGSEAINFLDPKTGIKVHARPGESFEERVAAYKDPGKHAVVVTHQALRDDSIKILAEALGKTEDEASTWAMNAGEKELEGALDSAFKAKGIDFQGLMMDEGHDALNRKGKPDSLLAKILDSHAHNAPYYMPATGSPVKNDPSEAFDWLHKLDPGRYPREGREEFLRRYGSDSAVSRRGLKAELSRYFFAERVHPGVAAHRHQHTVALTAGQRSDIDRIERASGKLRLGEDSLKWAKELAPDRFEGVPEGQHQAIADGIKKAVGTFKQAAMDRAINVGGGKVEASVQHAKDSLAEGKPVVIFAHRLESVAALHKAMEEAGIPVVSLTGHDSSTEKVKKLASFQGANHTADVIILSDAGATGANLQRGKHLIHYDQPMTYKTHEQRSARIHRLGQTQDVDITDLVADHEHERKSLERVARKKGLADIYQGKEGYLDDSGIAEDLRSLRARQSQANEEAA